MKQGDVIYKYEPLWGDWYVEKLLGRGAYGSVYKISREKWGYKETSAVKIISILPDNYEQLDLSMVNMNTDSMKSFYTGIIQKYIKEIQLLYKLKGNNNIVSYEDHIVCDGEGEFEWNIFIRMEYLMPLSNFIQENDLTTRDAIKIGIDICSGLEECKKINIIHRDIKEANIFVSGNGMYKIGDFGISREIIKSSSIASIKGTPYYMAPESFKESNYDERVDIYSLGLVLYKLFNYGRMPFLPKYPKPFTSSDREKSFDLRIKGTPIEVPVNACNELSKVILKSCAYKPNDRYPSAAKMKKDLIRLLDILTTKEQEKIITINQKKQSYMNKVYSKSMVDSAFNLTSDSKPKINSIKRKSTLPFTPSNLDKFINYDYSKNVPESIVKKSNNELFLFFKSKQTKIVFSIIAVICCIVLFYIIIIDMVGNGGNETKNKILADTQKQNLLTAFIDGVNNTISPGGIENDEKMIDGNSTNNQNSMVENNDTQKATNSQDIQEDSIMDLAGVWEGAEKFPDGENSNLKPRIRMDIQQSGKDVSIEVTLQDSNYTTVICSGNSSISGSKFSFEGIPSKNEIGGRFEGCTALMFNITIVDEETISFSCVYENSKLVSSSSGNLYKI